MIDGRCLVSLFFFFFIYTIIIINKKCDLYNFYKQRRVFKRKIYLNERANKTI